MFDLNKSKQELLDSFLKEEKLRVSKILLVLYDEIMRLQNEGYCLTDILCFLENEFNVNIPYSNFQRWIYRKKEKKTVVTKKTFITEMKKERDIDALKKAFKNKPYPKRDELI